MESGTSGTGVHVLGSGMARCCSMNSYDRYHHTKGEVPMLARMFGYLKIEKPPIKSANSPFHSEIDQGRDHATSLCYILAR